MLQVKEMYNKYQVQQKKNNAINGENPYVKKLVKLLPNIDMSEVSNMAETRESFVTRLQEETKWSGKTFSLASTASAV